MFSRARGSVGGVLTHRYASLPAFDYRDLELLVCLLSQGEFQCRMC